jgi:branched-subunit amino acid transport protein
VKVTSSKIVATFISASRSFVISKELSASQQFQDAETGEASLASSKTIMASITAFLSSVISGEDSASEQPAVLAKPSETSTEKENLASSQVTTLAIEATAAALVLMIAGLLVFLFLKRRASKEKTLSQAGSDGEEDIEAETELSGTRMHAFIEWNNPLGMDDDGQHAEDLFEDGNAYPE